MTAAAATPALFNILRYTSVLPPQSYPVSTKEEMQKHFHHGAALGTIMSQQTGTMGQVITVGVGSAFITKLDPNDPKKNEFIGGYAVEYIRRGDPWDTEQGETAKAENALVREMNALLKRRYGADYSDPKKYKLERAKNLIISHKIAKRYGCVIAALCFFTYEYYEADSKIDVVYYGEDDKPLALRDAVLLEIV